MILVKKNLAICFTIYRIFIMHSNPNIARKDNRDSTM